MLWLKRNLAWVLAILVAVVLTGAGGYYIWSGSSSNEELNQKLGQAKAELNRLTTEVKPSPNEENVRLVREDVRKSDQYAALVRRLFVATPYTPLSGQAYRSMLETNLAGLRRMAAVSGVKLVTNYTFSFEPQTRQMTFQPASLKPLSEQLTEISEVCRALFTARIARLEQIRRVGVSEWDTQGAADILPNIAITTNRFTGLYIWPYEFTFECFSSELAASLEELSRIPRMLIVKTISVEASESTTPRATLPGPLPTEPGRVPGDVIPRRPPGRPGAPGVSAVPAVVAPRPGSPPPPKSTALSTVLEEGLLRVVIHVQVIKPFK